MFPFTGLRLLLPAVVPSWRFFDAVTASPRVEYAVIAATDCEPEEWLAFRPRVAVLTPGAMLGRLLWNAEWNEDLYFVSLAERLMSRTTPATLAHSERELLRRVARYLSRSDPRVGDSWLSVRLRFVHRPAGSDEVVGEVVYVSEPHAIAALAAA